MDTRTGKVYESETAAIADGAHPDDIVQGSRAAIDRLKKRLFPKRRRAKLRRAAGR